MPLMITEINVIFSFYLKLNKLTDFPLIIYKGLQPFNYPENKSSISATVTADSSQSIRFEINLSIQAYLFSHIFSFIYSDCVYKLVFLSICTVIQAELIHLFYILSFSTYSSDTTPFHFILLAGVSKIFIKLLHPFNYSEK